MNGLNNICHFKFAKLKVLQLEMKKGFGTFLQKAQMEAPEEEEQPLENEEEVALLQQQARLANLRKRSRKLQQELLLQERANKSMSFELERQRIVQVSIWFYILLVPTIVCTFGSYTKGTYTWTAINGFGFLLVWRSLYARQNAIWFVATALILAYTIKNV